ncbi:MAG: hypothetical protein QJR02_07245 [Sinobacteraceae bacterium]|nr:hypothetical protein [Nevskiaceae bacterium]
MNIDAIASWLKPKLPSYADVRPARSMESDPSDVSSALPVLLLHPWQEIAGPNLYDATVTQRVAEQFACVSVCAITDLETRRSELFAALLGAQPPGYEDIVLYVKGEVVGISASLIWWRDIYSIGFYRRST